MSNLKFILASSSPRRIELLQKIGVTPDFIISPNLDETPKKFEDPTAYVKRIALEKAISIFKEHTDSLVLSADTIVLKGRRILGKAKNEKEAYDMISLLSGSRHKVLTAFCVCSPTLSKPIVKITKTSVLLKNLSEKEKLWFLASKEWEGKSGSYAIQGIFELFIKQINGSISSVVGLPLLQVYNVLIGLGYNFNYGTSKEKE